MGRDDDEEVYTPSHLPQDTSLKSITSITGANQDPEKMKKDAIETVLSPTVQYLANIPEPAAKALAAVGTGGASVLVTQSIPASTMESLYQLGALNNVTQDGATPLLIAGASGGIPMMVGIMAATDGVLEVLKTEAPEITAAKLITNQRETSRLERWTHSWPTAITQFCFWGTLMFAYLSRFRISRRRMGQFTFWRSFLHLGTHYGRCNSCRCLRCDQQNDEELQ